MTPGHLYAIVLGLVVLSFLVVAVLAWCSRRAGEAVGRAQERARTAGEVAAEAERVAAERRARAAAAPARDAGADAEDVAAARATAAETRAAPPTPPRRPDGVRAGERPRSSLADELGLGARRGRGRR